MRCQYIRFAGSTSCVLFFRVLRSAALGVGELSDKLIDLNSQRKVQVLSYLYFLSCGGLPAAYLSTRRQLQDLHDWHQVALRMASLWQSPFLDSIRFLIIPAVIAASIAVLLLIIVAAWFFLDRESVWAATGFVVDSDSLRLAITTWRSM